MANSVQKITLSGSRDIPFNKLVLSQSNVRRIKAGISVEELAEDIARRTLLQSLNVRPVLDADGAETGMFEIPAGGRRYQALALLVKQKRLAKTALIPCVVRDPATSILAEDDSLAENVQRAALHPLDQFRAFQTLREKGQSEDDIAAAFFVSVNVVKQRLRLACRVAEAARRSMPRTACRSSSSWPSPSSSDHARQEQVWEAIQNSWSQGALSDPPHADESARCAPPTSARLFVGLDAYEAAGGIVMRDLFQRGRRRLAENVALLDRLVAEKLKAEAEKIAAEGWKWVEAAVDFPYGHDHHLRELDGTPLDLTAEEQATIAALNAEHDSLEAEYSKADELPDEVDQRIGEIETALVKLRRSAGSVTIRPTSLRAGAFVSIDEDGSLRVDRGYVRPEDEAAASDPEDGSGGQADADGADDASRPHPPCIAPSSPSAAKL